MAACALLFLVFKFGPIRKILAFDVPIDIATTLILGIMFFGTLGGMMVAITAGAIVSIVLFIAKKIFGAERLTWKGWQPQPQPHQRVRHIWEAMRHG